MQYTWKAIYKDNSELPQYGNDGKVNGYQNIDRINLRFFDIIDENKKLVFRLHMEEGKRLIFRSTVSQDINSNKINWRIIMVGWQKTVNGENIQSITYIFEDGHIEQAGNWAFGSPVLKDYENIIGTEV